MNKFIEINNMRYYLVKYYRLCYPPLTPEEIESHLQTYIAAGVTLAEIKERCEIFEKKLDDEREERQKKIAKEIFKLKIEHPEIKDSDIFVIDNQVKVISKKKPWYKPGTWRCIYEN